MLAPSPSLRAPRATTLPGGALALLLLSHVATSVLALGGVDDSERLIGWLGEVARPGALRGSGRSRDRVGEGSGASSDGAGGDGRRQWIEQISTHPRAYVWHGFMSDEECDHVVHAAEPLMEKSGVIDAKTGEQTFDPIRTSYGAFLPIGYDDVIARIEQRAAEWAMIPSSHQEQLHVLRYTEGQQYADHWDAFDSDVKEKINYANGRQRLATILMYLNDVEEGGETVFPHPTAEWAPTAEGAKDGMRWSKCASRGPAVKPAKGDALLFYDLAGPRGDVQNFLAFSSFLLLSLARSRRLARPTLNAHALAERVWHD